MVSLRSQQFFWQQDRLMSYFYVKCVIWCHTCHLLSNDAYDIKLWHKSIWPILVSKEATWPQWSHLLIHFAVQNNCFKIKKNDNRKNRIFPLWFFKILCIIEVESQKVKCCRKIWKSWKCIFVYWIISYFLESKLGNFWWNRVTLLHI